MSYRKNRQAVKEGKILKERRQELGFTQLEVASECGVELQQYQRFEYGQRSRNGLMLHYSSRSTKVWNSIHTTCFSLKGNDFQGYKPAPTPKKGRGGLVSANKCSNTSPWTLITISNYRNMSMPLWQ